MSIKKLNASVPANNWKIIELYNKIKKEELDPSPSFQRKLVWKKQHKYRFIETILMNFPFPEIYIAPGELNTETLTLQDLIVDGQQRCTTIVNYIEGKDVFANRNQSIKLFNELSKEEKEDFLNFEVSVRYLKNAEKDQIKEIFQRINSTEYSLNAIERDNAKWGDSEFISFAKQIIDEDDKINYDIISYKLLPENKSLLNDFFVNEFKIFSENDIKRMLALQYLLTLITTLIEGNYFRRNDKIQNYIEQFNEEFMDASIYEFGLVDCVKFINKLELPEKSYWFNKANVFTIICELFKFDNIDNIDYQVFKDKLIEIETNNKEYRNSSDNYKEKIEGEIKYFEVAKEAVNEQSSREFRGKFINDRIILSLK
ncbi:DUF262 domain-containing protein [Myroides phaeus]|uniref:DUF262 domain-containing protein n=1 Tax=Myroides phaeus TaxID=702745 RepID=UPI001303AA6B|nr:DUF262 domain-containing protein [Myroides phaeus]